MRLLRETLPHALIGAVVALPSLAAPGWWPLLAVPQAVVWGLAREHAQAREKAMWVGGGDLAPGCWKRVGEPGLIPDGWLTSKRRWLDVAEIAAGAGLVTAVALWL